MTNAQKQHLLAYLGYYTGTADGIWGPMSRQAGEAFQRDFMESVGEFGPRSEARLLEVVASGEKRPVSESDTTAGALPTEGTFWEEIEFFDREEFRCQCQGKYCCGFPVEPAEKLVRAVDEIRRRLGVPVSIVDAGGSGVRCLVHNANVGGVADSQHIYGLAADLHSQKSPAEMKAVAEEVLGETGGIGLYGWGIHVDVRPVKARWNG